MSEISPVIAIDGPSGSGKSSIAKLLAGKLKVLYIDTGAMFRAIGLYIQNNNIDFTDVVSIEKLISDMKMSYGESNSNLISINGENLTNQIREHSVSKLASIVSQISCVRKFLLDFQRTLAVGDSVCVMEGRDIGTVVFPKSFVKFFITARTEVRAKRRYEQLLENASSNIDFEQILSDIEKRDLFDTTREEAPLKQAKDSLFLDSSDMNLDEVINSMIDQIKTQASLKGINLPL